MALPAGRYGVTKNQLLKVKKLPMNTIKLIEDIQEELDTFGTAVTHDATSVVTDSTDLVESGAVKDIVGWGNRNLFDPSVISQTQTLIYSPFYVGSGEFTCSTDAPQNTASGANLFLIAGNVQSGASTLINGVWNGNPRTVTAIDGYVTIVTRAESGVNISNYHNQLEKGSTATAYEPYHASVEESLAEKCDNSVIGTVEDGTNPTKSYAVGEHFIRNGKFCTCISAVTTSSDWTLNTNYVEGTIADNLSAVDVTSEFTFANDITFVTTSGWTKIYKVGNIIKGYLRFTTPSTVSIDKVVVTIPTKYLPRTSGMYFSSLVEAWTGVTCGLLANGANAITLISDTWEASKSVVANFEYVI